MSEFFTKDDENLKWQTLNSEKVFESIVFDIYKDFNVPVSKASDFKGGNYFYLKAPDWAIVIPCLDDDFLMVKQWRHGEKKLSIEFPGGVIDKGENPEAAARRELKEETGFSANKLTLLGKVNPNPALFSNHVHIFLAEDLTDTGNQSLDDDEMINYIRINKKEVIKNMGTEEFPHGLMCTALMFYLKQNL